MGGKNLFKVEAQTVPPGQIYPVPTITDDRERLPEETVRSVLEWLKSVAEDTAKIGKPTNQIVGHNRYDTVNPLTNRVLSVWVDGVVYPPGRPVPAGKVVFFQRTYETFIKPKDGLPVCAHHYLGAVNRESRKVLIMKEKPLWTVPLRPMP